MGILTYTDLETLLNELDALCAITVRPGDTLRSLPDDDSCATYGCCAGLAVLPGYDHRGVQLARNAHLVTHFRRWLHMAGYGVQGRLVYGLVLQLALKHINRNWHITTEADFREAVQVLTTGLADAHLCHHVREGLAIGMAYCMQRKPRVPLNIAPSDALLLKARAPQEKPRPTKAVSTPCRTWRLPLLPMSRWNAANQAFLRAFRAWLNWSGLTPTTIGIYSVVCRLACSLSKGDWTTWDEAHDTRVLDVLRTQVPESETRLMYLHGLSRLRKFVQLQQTKDQTPPPQLPSPPSRSLKTHPRSRKHIPSDALPETIMLSLKRYFEHARRNWPPHRAQEIAAGWLNRMTLPLRRMREMGIEISHPSDITPHNWYRYVDARRADGKHVNTINIDLNQICGWLVWLLDSGDQQIDARMLKIRLLKKPQRLPRDVPAEHLRVLQREIELEAFGDVPDVRRRGCMDLAWFLLMLHSGLRSGEVRFLKDSEIDWSRRALRIEVSKNLRSRIVPLSEPGATALNAWVTLRGECPTAPGTVFVIDGARLKKGYLASRMRIYAARTGKLRVTPHQLRHSCATLLLNNGMPIEQVQTLLGHVSIDTTRGYARPYDRTIAADYTRAMLSVAEDLGLPGTSAAPTPAQTVALLDSLRQLGPLNDQQLDTIAKARAAVGGFVRIDGPPQLVAGP